MLLYVVGLSVNKQFECIMYLFSSMINSIFIFILPSNQIHIILHCLFIERQDSMNLIVAFSSTLHAF